MAKSSKDPLNGHIIIVYVLERNLIILTERAYEGSYSGSYEGKLAIGLLSYLLEKDLIERAYEGSYSGSYEGKLAIGLLSYLLEKVHSD